MGIPRIIHYCWLSNEPFPELVLQCVNSWKKNLPNYQFILWDTNRFDINNNLWVKQAFESKKYAFAADYIRIYSLYHYGGIYLDTDVEVLKNFEPFHQHAAFTGFESKTDIEAAVMGAEKGNPWLKDILNYYNDKAFIKEDGSYDTKILPVIISIISQEKYGFVPNGKYQELKSDIHIYPEDFFSPKNIRTHQINITKNSVTIHHFNAGWVKKGLIYKIKRITHLFLMQFGDSFHSWITKSVRKFTGNAKI